MSCYRIDIPAESALRGVTAQGQPTTVLPGQYVVHEVRKLPFAAPMLRLVGADAFGRDVHVRKDAVVTRLVVMPEENARAA